MMKKLLLILFASFLFASYTQAQQELTLSMDGDPIGDTVMVVGLPEDFEIVLYAEVTNNTSEAITLQVFRERLDMVGESSSAFCWGLCFSPDVDSSFDGRTIKADSTSFHGEFSGHYYPKNEIGTSMVKYTFYDQNNPDTRVSFVAKYKGSPEGIAEEAMRGGFVSEVYPNPATSVVNLDYQLTNQVEEANVKVFNILGAVVKEADLNRGNGKLQMNIADLKNGVYFYSVLVNGDVYQTKKLIIQK
jgi:hypothetical protein